MSNKLKHLRLGTRGSLLATVQSQQVADALMAANPGLHVELVQIKTTGDRITDKPLHEFGGKGLFVKELELALLDGRIDLAVHSYKDVPVTMPLVDQSGLAIAAVPKREAAGDVLISRVADSITSLPPGAVVGTGSLRRRCQLLDARPDLVVREIRGNIDTRMKRIDSDCAAVVLAEAGLRRANLFNPISCYPIANMIGAPGQGALALQTRATDGRTRNVVATLNDAPTMICVNAEREIVRLLNGDCHSPIAAAATIDGSTVSLQVAVGGRDGQPPLHRASGIDAVERLSELVARVFGDLARSGAVERLAASG